MVRTVIALPSGIDGSARDLLALRRIPARVAAVVAGLLVLAAVPLAPATPPAPAAQAAVPTISPAVVADALATLAALRTQDELPDDELLPLPMRGPAGGLVPLRPAPALVVPPPRPAAGVARVSIPRLGIDHYVQRVAIVGGVMESPADGVYAIGWYPQFGEPGSGGNAVFSAHETWEHYYAPFYALHLAQQGDEVAVEMASGARYRYAVTSSHRYPLETLPMGVILSPPALSAGEEWLTFITCGGRLVYDASGFGDYLDRDIVVAKSIR